MNATQRSRLQIIKAPTVIKPHDQEGVGVARPCQVQSDQEEDYTAADIILKNAIERRKLAIRARRASGGADHQAPHPPVHNLASLPPAAPAHRAGTKRQATWLPPGASGVRQLPQNQLQALAPPRQHPAAPALAQYQGQHPAAPALAQYQGQPAQMEYEAAPVPVPVHPPQPPQMEHEAALVPVPVHPPPKQRPRQHATTPAAPYAPHAPDAAARMPPRQVNTSSKPPLHPRSPANPAAGNKPSIVCRVCGVRCMTAFNLRQHEEGRRHRNNVANAAGEVNVRCEMCDVHLSGELNVQEHYAGKQHLHRVFVSGASGAAGEINVRCEMCDVHLSGELNVQEHYAGKHHLRRVFLSSASGTAGNPAT
ncbi:zinc finger matrin-type protein 4-like [Hordeum vulgare]|nr:zinc finger matrin-type protein 4-like [Hordeum vulgare]